MNTRVSSPSPLKAAAPDREGPLDFFRNDASEKAGKHQNVRIHISRRAGTQ